MKLNKLKEFHAEVTEEALNYMSMAVAINNGALCYIDTIYITETGKMYKGIISSDEIIPDKEMDLVKVKDIIREVIEEEFDGICINKKLKLPLSEIRKLNHEIAREEEMRLYVRENLGTIYEDLGRNAIRDINNTQLENLPKSLSIKGLLIQHSSIYAENTYRVIAYLMRQYTLTLSDLDEMERKLEPVSFSKKKEVLENIRIYRKKYID